MKAEDIREKFLNYFKSKGHKIVTSAPIVQKDDPTLLFTNAGMNQFKDIFLGDKKPNHSRITDTQKCLRVSGKHNDLEEVGLDTYHHTMFEMLGNWSFGDYFKKEAIKWAWELLTDVYGIDENRLYVTIFGGDLEDKLETDKEAFDAWKEIVDEQHILRFDKKDNFWEMGSTGPCGPSSEIHIDLRDENERYKTDARDLINKDHPEVVELWNLVFIQFNRLQDGILKPLSQRHIDTGMGFERLCMVLQEKRSNYDTDVFIPLIKKIELVTGKKYGQNDQQDIAIRVLADHVRAVSFTIGDGQLPSNTGAGYVVRRILRRAVRYAYSYLDKDEPVLHELVPVLSGQFKETFPEISAQEGLIKKVIKEEEQNFLRTLATGLKKLSEFAENGKKKIEGGAAFELYDTYGFPLDLTRLIASEKGMEVDEKGFREAMKRQKERSKKAAETEMGEWQVLKKAEEVEFVGYDILETKAEIIKYRQLQRKGKDFFQVVLDKTPFYAESGGQVGDQGVLEWNGEKVRVIDTKKENELIIHFTDKLPAEVSGEVTAKVNAEKRKNAALNHTATHLLHAALKQVLGDHVQQKGSLVHPEYLRFDFSHFSKVSNEELEKVEKLVNGKVRENIPLDEVREMPLEEAKKMGATALFGEKYGEKVRVVCFDRNYSVELCGGTHVEATGQIGLFKITSESAVASGIRRIEAMTGKMAEEHIGKKVRLLSTISEILKNPDPLKGVEQLQQENKKLQKELGKLSAVQVNSAKEELKGKMETIDDIRFIGAKADVNNADALKKLAFDLLKDEKNLMLILGAEANGKALLTIALSNDLVKEKDLHAGNLIRELAKEIKGGGGGQPFFATAGGSDISGIERAIEKGKKLI